MVCQDVPGGPVVKNLPFDAGDVGSIPGQGAKIVHASGKLSPLHKRSPRTSLKTQPKLKKKKKKKRNKVCSYRFLSPNS